jgi:hypothetical protein
MRGPNTFFLSFVFAWSASCALASGQPVGDKRTLWLLATESRAMGTADRRIEVYSDSSFVCSASEANVGSIKTTGRLTVRQFAKLRRDVSPLFVGPLKDYGPIPADANVLSLAISPDAKPLAVRPEEAQTRRDVRRFVEVWNRIARVTACHVRKSP